MYCSHCGKEIKENAKFCSACGEKIEVIYSSSEIDNKPRISKEKKQTKKSFFVVLGVVICIILIVVFAGKVYKSRSIEKAKEQFDNGAYKEAVESFENAFNIGDMTPENYIMQATAYVEMGELYQAKEVLKEGYQKTGAEELLNVSIWGPMSDEDIIFLFEFTPMIRQEYCFNGDSVKGYQYEKGLVRLEKNYYFDSKGNVIGMDLNDFQSYSFGGGDKVKLFPWDIEYIGEDYTHIIDLNYAMFETEGIVELNLNNSPYIILYYENGVCKYVKEAENTDNIVYALGYDDKGRIVNISTGILNNDDIQITNDFQIEIKYNMDGSYLLQSSSSWGRNDTIQFDETGRELRGESLYYTLSTWSVEWEKGRVKKIYENDELIYEFEYDDNGCLSRAKNWRSGLETLSITCDELGRFTYIHYKDIIGEEIKKTISYDEGGRCVSTVLETVSIGNIVFHDCEYSEKGELLRIISKNGEYSGVEEFIYDELGRKLGSTHIEYLYNPGTYTGIADGWASEMIVEVTVDESSIISVEVIEHGETYGVGTKVFEPIIENVIGGNTTEVDLITGSTISSQNLLNAINDALEQAKIQ